MKRKELIQLAMMASLAILMIIAWNPSMALAQTKNTDAGGKPLQTGSYGSSSEGMGMSQYLIAVPRSSSYANCEDQIRKLANEVKSGADNRGMTPKGEPGISGTLHQAGARGWEWGCSSDDKTVYILTRASSEQAALNNLPESVRSEARVIRLSQYAEMGSMSQNVKSSEQPGKEYSRDPSQEKYKAKSGTSK